MITAHDHDHGDPENSCYQTSQKTVLPWVPWAAGRVVMWKPLAVRRYRKNGSWLLGLTNLWSWFTINMFIYSSRLSRWMWCVNINIHAYKYMHCIIFIHNIYIYDTHPFVDVVSPLLLMMYQFSIAQSTFFCWFNRNHMQPTPHPIYPTVVGLIANFVDSTPITVDSITSFDDENHSSIIIPNETIPLRIGWREHSQEVKPCC